MLKYCCMTLKMGLNKLCKVLLQWEIHFLDALRSTIMKSKPIETICSQTHCIRNG